MAERVRGYMGRLWPPEPLWVPLWSGEGDEVDRIAVVNRRHACGWADGELVVMYSGNMGLGHRFAEILEMIGKESERDSACLVPNSQATRYVFFGGGKRRGEIERFLSEHPEAPVELHDYAPAEILGAHLRSADVHLASLDGKWTGTMVPSKLQGIFAAGRPVIFVGDERSSIGRWVIDSGGGWVVAPGDVAGLAAAIEEARDSRIVQSCGRAAAGFAAEHFDRKTNVRKVAGVFAG